jgi:hypothetical protein
VGAAPLAEKVIAVIMATTIIVAGFAKEARGSWRSQVVRVVIAQSVNSAALTERGVCKWPDAARPLTRSTH